MSAPGGVLPEVVRDDATAGFFDAAGRGELLLQRSRATGQVFGPEVRACPETGVGLEPVVASGDGVLVSWVVVRQAPVPALAASVPYVSAVVEVSEGPWLVVRLVGSDGGDLAVGQPVRADFVRSGGEDRSEEAEVLPVFAPIGKDVRA